MTTEAADGKAADGKASDDGLRPWFANAPGTGIRASRLDGWPPLPLVRAMALAFGLGLLAALALPPVYAVPLAVAGLYRALLWLLDGAPGNRRRSFALIGWAFGFGFFIAGLYWVGHRRPDRGRERFWCVPADCGRRRWPAVPRG